MQSFWRALKWFADVLGVAQFLQWLGVASTAAAVAGWAAAWFLSVGSPWNVAVGVGIGLVALGSLPRIWHRLETLYRTASHFELVSSELICDPPLARTPVHATRVCSLQAVFVNRGRVGNAVAVIRYIGIGRAGNERPTLERRVVIPTTQPGSFAEIQCNLGEYPPVENRFGPVIEVEHAAHRDRERSKRTFI